jgi:hypothetical protein
MRDAEPRPLDFLSLAAMSDAFFGRIFQVIGRIPPFGTISMSTYFHAGADELAAHGTAPLAAVADAHVFHRSFCDQSAELYGAGGQLLATTSQVAYYNAWTGLQGLRLILTPMTNTEVQPLAAATVAALEGVATATLTTVLLKKGCARVDSRRAPARDGPAAAPVGRAFTLRFVPAREDLATPASWGRADLDPRRDRGDAGGVIAVVDAMGVRDAGIFGDILCARMRSATSRRWSPTASCATSPACSAPGLPVWCAVLPRRPR